MSTPVHILDGGSAGSKVRSKVSSIGQLITSPFAYDETVFDELDATGTAFNFYGPKTGQQFVITGIRMKADRNVSNTVDATVIVFEASSITDTTPDKILHEEALIRGESVTLLPVNVLVNTGKFINATTTDASIFMTILGYYIPVLS